MEINTWSPEARYQRLESLTNNYISLLREAAVNDPYYPQFHIAPRHGLLNDPNGLCQINGEHHIFYQWTPVGATHGLKYWYHVSTSDFINYTDHGVGLNPNGHYDSHGCYSGSALVENDKAYLFFTGNSRDTQWKRTSTQCLAVMNQEGVIEKQGIIINNEHYTEHFRDPKVWKDGEHYYMVVGVQTHELKGQVALYQSETLDNWHHRGLIKTAYPDFGYMWECPDLFTLDGHTVLLFSPQGVKDDSKYRFSNIYHVGYLLGDGLNIKSLELENHQPIVELDSGFDFYAPQTYEDEQGRRVLIGWIGLPDINYPTDKNHWAHMLSLPRQLSVQDGALVQKPLPELQACRSASMNVQGRTVLQQAAFELELSTDANQLELILANDTGDQVRLTMDNAEFELDRSEMTDRFAIKYGTSRFVQRKDRHQHIHLFFDHSVIEIFLNNGKNTITGRVFIRDLSTMVLSDGLIGKLHYLNRSQYQISKSGCDFKPSN